MVSLLITLKPACVFILAVPILSLSFQVGTGTETFNDTLDITTGKLTRERQLSLIFIENKSLKLSGRSTILP